VRDEPFALARAVAELILPAGCRSANCRAHDSQADARDWMFHSFMGAQIKP
jgi:hypothetical protein